jgi:predicted amidohydrolase
MIKLSAIQLNSKANVEQNLVIIAQQLKTLVDNPVSTQGVINGTIHNGCSNKDKVEHIVVLPECCLFFGSNDTAQFSLAKNTHKNNDLQQKLSELAKQFNVTLIGGTIPLLTDDGNKFTNTSCAFNGNGELIGRYDKIHLFDVNVEDNKKSYCESRLTQAGKNPCMVNTAFAKIGLSVCFDVRFPMLFQQLTKMGADIITVPSAFTRVTGRAHWQTLLQARAIENQVYIIAAGQEGVHENGRETWGHSMIISPWGDVLACLDEGEGIISCDFNPQEIKRIRTSMPLKHTADIKS